MRKIIVGLMLMILFSLLAQNPEKTFRKGLRVNLQSEQLDITLPYFLEYDVEFAPSLSVIHAGKIGTDLGFGLSLRKYLKTTKVSPFIGVRGGLLWYIPDGEDSTYDYIVGLCGGSEYFFDHNLSVGVEFQLNSSFSDKYSYRFGNPGEVIINTASAVSVSIYW